ncbi:two-component response regulator-like APRR9 isoform X1 [Salvia hispanica]|uniref:two-component response regulator-like APRR9 isoform X1 n=1 Tax=Salvia hispanica TaxID=49212 RepID=UPI0020091433|nr:two-component response regulator-like APRR9 isoform X1 [Salvia hispanica]
MYAPLVHPYFPQEVHHFEDFGCSHKPNASSGTPNSYVQAFAVSDDNIWGEGDLFNAPQPVIEEPVMGLDPMTVAISMISCGEDAISPQSLSVSDVESSIESGQLLSEVFYECRKDILAKEGNETPLSEVLSINIPTVKSTSDEKMLIDEKSSVECSFQKSVSSSCLRSMDNDVHEAPLRPSFLDFAVEDFEAAYGMRRAYSEGDIKALCNGSINHVESPMGQVRVMSSCISEVRREKLSRYWSKKSKRNFGRKIKYACRKALADSQPRVRGRFAKTEETEAGKKL